MTGYTKKEVAKILNIQPSKVAHYSNIGLVTPSIANPVGRGTTRRYSKNDIMEFVYIKELMARGFVLREIQAMKKTVYDDICLYDIFID